MQGSDATLLKKLPPAVAGILHNVKKLHIVPTADGRLFLFHFFVSFKRTILHILSKDKIVVGKSIPLPLDFTEVGWQATFQVTREEDSVLLPFMEGLCDFLLCVLEH